MKRSTLIPILLLIYLAVMAYISRQELTDGHYLFYFGVIGLTLACIIGLHFTLRHRERNRRKVRPGSKHPPGHKPHRHPPGRYRQKLTGRRS